MATVLVTDVKYRMTLSLIRTLAELGHRVVAVSFAPEDDPPTFACRGVSHREVLPDRESLLGLCRKYTFDGVKPTLLAVGGETITFLCAKEEIATCANVLLPESKALALANNKRELHKVAASIGIRVPAERTRTEVERAISVGEDAFPLVVKFECGEKLGLPAAERYRVVHTAEELHSACRNVEAYGEKPIVQEYIRGEGVGCSVVLDRNGLVRSYVCHRRLREYPVSGGPSALCESFYDPVLVEWSVKLLRTIGFAGVAMVEWKKTEDGYCLMEINPRVWGTFPLTRIAKSDFVPQWLAASASDVPGQATLPPPSYRIGLRMKFLTGELRLFLWYLKKGKLGSATRVLVEILSLRVREGVLELSDLRASLRYLGSLRKR